MVCSNLQSNMGEKGVLKVEQLRPLYYTTVMFIQKSGKQLFKGEF